MGNVLPDLIAPNLRIVFTGTAVGSASAHAGAYYAGPGNAFWPTLHAVGLTPRLLAAQRVPDPARLHNRADGRVQGRLRLRPGGGRGPV